MAAESHHRVRSLDGTIVKFSKRWVTKRLFKTKFDKYESRLHQNIRQLKPPPISESIMVRKQITV